MVQCPVNGNLILTAVLALGSRRCVAVCKVNGHNTGCFWDHGGNLVHKLPVLIDGAVLSGSGRAPTPQRGQCKVTIALRPTRQSCTQRVEVRRYTVCLRFVLRVVTCPARTSKSSTWGRLTESVMGHLVCLVLDRPYLPS